MWEPDCTVVFVVIETVTTGCPAWSACEKNPVRSFWGRVSAAVSQKERYIFTFYAKTYQRCEVQPWKGNMSTCCGISASSLITMQKRTEKGLHQWGFVWVSMEPHCTALSWERSGPHIQRGPFLSSAAETQNKSTSDKLKTIT